jgi:hypothetical protein
MVSGYDPAYSQSLRAQMRYLMGAGWDEADGFLPSSNSVFPVFPESNPVTLKEGKSRQILNNLFIELARIRYLEIEPEFPQVELPVTAEARKQFWLSRARGHGLPGHQNWSDQLDSAVFEGNALGIGFIQIGLTHNPDTQKRRVALRHVPTINVLWDRHESHASRAKWIAFCHYLAPEVARATYGEKAVEGLMSLHEKHAGTLEFVRVIEYFDLGDGHSEPTYAVFAGDINGPMITHQSNPFNTLPFASYSHLYVPGVRRPVGRISLQLCTQERINSIERFLDEAIQQPPFTVLDNSLIDEQDLNRLAGGEKLSYVKMNARATEPGRPPFYQVPGALVSGYVGERYSMLVQQLNADSGITDYDRGNLSIQSRTATEIEVLNQRVGAQGTWPLRQLSRFMQQAVSTTCDIARKYDEDTCDVDVFGVNLTINAKDNPDFSAQELFKEPSRVEISEETILESDSRSKRDRKLRSLERLLPLAQIGAIKMEKLTKEILRANGVVNPNDWLVNA